MDDKFIIKFDNIHGAATKYSFPLGETILSVAAPTCVIAYDDYTPFCKDLYDPYKTYITIAFPPQTWRTICKDDGPTPQYQMEKVIKTIQQIFLDNKLFLNFYFTLELNNNCEYIHLHGVLTKKRNMNQLIKFKKFIRKYFDIPSLNKIAIKTYQQSQLRKEQDQLNYHLKSVSYDGQKKDRILSCYYHVSGYEASVVSEQSTIN